MFDPAAAEPPAEPSILEFIPPATVRLGDCRQRAGGVVYRLLRSLFAAPGRARSIAELERDVWGGPVNRNTLWSACRRARQVLEKVNHPLRVAIDGDRITLV